MTHSCWSYEYYVRPIFENKKSATDSLGWDLADIVNTSSVGYFYSNATSTQILLEHLFRGAENLKGDKAKIPSWQSMIKAINNGVAQRMAGVPVQGGKAEQELFGVSGVRTNKFEP
jgi:hypothetical protein